MSRLWLRLRALLRRDALDPELDEELRFHLSSLEDQNRRAGQSDDEARRQARLSFGNPLALRERSRELFSFVRLESLAQETRHAARRLRRAPAFTTVALVTLALGIGVNAALFALVDAALLRPLPYAEPERLLTLSEVDLEHGDQQAVAPANLADYRIPALEGLAACATETRDLTGAFAPETLTGQIVGHGFFELLGVAPVLGRTFLPEEMVPGSEKVVILSHRLFARRFGADPAVVGRLVSLDGEPHLVVGVLPPSFRAPEEIGARQPFAFFAPAAFSQELLASRGDHEVHVVARLRAGVSLEQARAQISAVGESLARAYPDSNGVLRPLLTPLHEELSREVRSSLLILLGACGAALLIACLNLSSLLLVRTLGRAREIAVRVALGAGRAQALRGILVEAGLLALAGGVLGVALAQAALRAISALAPAAARADEAHLDGRVIGFALLAAGLTAFVSALLPARQVSHVHPHESLRSVERGLVAAPALRLGRALLVAEVALSLILLVGGGLLVRSLRHLYAVDIGFQTERVLAASIKLPPKRYPDRAASLAFFEELAGRVAALPGVEKVAFANCFPLRGGWTTGITLDRQEDGREAPFLEAAAQAVSTGYFETLGVPLLQGRSLAETDRDGAPPVALVNETFVRRYLGGEEPMGRRFRRGPSAPFVEIVGVVADLYRDGPAKERQPQVYFPAAQTKLYPLAISDLAVRSRLEPRSVAVMLENEVARLDPEQPVNKVMTLREALERDLAQRRFASVLLSSFAVLALGLALVGIYGVTSYSVSRPTAELGLRLALGAEPRGLLRLVLGETGRPLGVGVALGLAGAWGVTRWLKGLLFATTPTDSATFAGMALALLATGLLAAALPAWRASRVDPTVALRSE